MTYNKNMNTNNNRTDELKYRYKNLATNGAVGFNGWGHTMEVWQYITSPDGQGYWTNFCEEKVRSRNANPINVLKKLSE